MSNDEKPTTALSSLEDAMATSVATVAAECPKPGPDDIVVTCPECGDDISWACSVLPLSLPAGMSAQGPVMANISCVIRPLLCPTCEKSTLKRPSRLAIPGGR